MIEKSERGGIFLYLPAIIASIAVLILTIIGFFVVRINYHSTVQAEFDRASQERAAAIQKSLSEKVLILESVNYMYSVIRELPGAEFRAFVKPFESELQGLQGLQWVMRVKHEDREAFENQKRLDGFGNYEIKELSQGVLVRAGQRDEYYPVTPVGPLDAEESFNGFDLASNTIRQQALEVARDTGTLTASARVRLVQETEEGQYGFLMFQPVYMNGTIPVSVAARRQEISGFIIAVFRIMDIIGTSIEVLEPEGIDITLRDHSAPPDEQFLYYHASRTRTVDGPDEPDNSAFLPGDYYTTFLIGGRTWEIKTSVAPAFMRSRQSSTEWLILFAGFAFSILLSFYLIVTGRHAETMRSAEAALREARDELEDRVMQRTRDLQIAQEELLKQGRLATLGQLTATVSHELRNPLGTALTSIDFLQQQLNEEVLTRGTNSALKRLERSILRCDRIIDELLDYTRLRAKDKKVIEMDKFLQEFLNEYDVPQEISVEIDPGAADIKVTLDDELLRRALINIVDNACQAMSGTGGNKKITIRTEFRDSSCHILIADNGAGMTEQVRNKVFEPLYSTKTYGVGLGLAIVQQIMEQLYGKIEIESVSGEGTTVSLSVPLNSDEIEKYP